MYGNGGGGHKASALAVKQALENCSVSAQLHVELVDASFIAGARFGDWLYNVLLSYNAVSAIELIHSVLNKFLLPLMRSPLRQGFRAHFANTPNLDCVVSFVPILNAIMADVLPSHVPLLTVLTDFSHTQTHPWMQHPRQHVVAGTDIAVAQALSKGYTMSGVASPSMCITPTSGMVVHPRFYARLTSTARHFKRASLGFLHDLPVVLLLFGANPPTDRVSRLVALYLAREAADAVNVIAICARNRALYNRLTRRKRRYQQHRLYVTGFTKEIPTFMQMSDVLVGKPGPGVVSEAFVSGLPFVLVTGATGSNVMQQEKDVLDWVQRQRIGIVARSEQEAASVSLAEIAEMQERIAQMPPNNAVFQVRDLILQSTKLPMDVDDGEAEANSRDSLLEKEDSVQKSKNKLLYPYEDDASRKVTMRLDNFSSDDSGIGLASIVNETINNMENEENTDGIGAVKDR